MTVPKLSVVIPCYLTNDDDKYLRLTLKSLANAEYPRDLFEVVLVSSGEFKPNTDELLQILPIKHVHSEERLHFAPAVNTGVRNTSPDSKLFLILSDDTIVTKKALLNMASLPNVETIVLNPISNCDNNAVYSLIVGYNTNSGYQHIPNRFYRYDDLKDHFDGLMNADSIYPPGIITQDYMCFYATMIPRAVWNQVGTFDERFKMGQEDIDYSWRCRDLGIPRAFVLNSLVWHFGGVTADKVLNDEKRRANIEVFRQKWGVLPP